MSKQDSSLLPQRHCFIVYSKPMSRRQVMPGIGLFDCKPVCLLANLFRVGWIEGQSGNFPNPRDADNKKMFL